MIQNPQDLAARIRKEAWTPVKVKVGSTNGQPVLHVRDLKARNSRTLKTEGEWLVHPANPRWKPARKREQDEEDAGS